jgi:hypothetical protein
MTRSLLLAAMLLPTTRAARELARQRQHREHRQIRHVARPVALLDGASGWNGGTDRIAAPGISRTVTRRSSCPGTIIMGRERSGPMIRRAPPA